MPFGGFPRCQNEASNCLGPLIGEKEKFNRKGGQKNSLKNLTQKKTQTSILRKRGDIYQWAIWISKWT